MQKIRVFPSTPLQGHLPLCHFFRGRHPLCCTYRQVLGSNTPSARIGLSSWSDLGHQMTKEIRVSPSTSLKGHFTWPFLRVANSFNAWCHRTSGLTKFAFYILHPLRYGLIRITPSSEVIKIGISQLNHDVKARSLKLLPISIILALCLRFRIY